MLIITIYNNNDNNTIYNTRFVKRKRCERVSEFMLWYAAECDGILCRGQNREICRANICTICWREYIAFWTWIHVSSKKHNGIPRGKSVHLDYYSYMFIYIHIMDGHVKKGKVCTEIKHKLHIDTRVIIIIVVIIIIGVEYEGEPSPIESVCMYIVNILLTNS